jgi:NAD(P)H-dependent FMN reductase
MSERPVLLIVIASTRPTRVGSPVAEWFRGRAEEHGAFEVEVADLVDVDLPHLDEPKHPRLREYEHQHTLDWSATVDRADAVVLVMPEYNHSFTGSLKNALDYLNQEWRDKAVGFVAYGGVSAGTRALAAIKPVVTALRMVPAVEAVTIPFVGQFLDEERRIRPNDVMQQASTAMLDELLRLTGALRTLRAGAAAGEG